MTRVRRWTWARRLTAALFLLLLALGAFEWFPWFKGTTTATTSFGVVPLVDPLAALDVMLASHTWEPTLLIGCGILVVFAVVMGPVFCGWACPLGLILDLGNGLWRRLQIRLQRRHGHSLISHNTKYVLLGAVIGFSLGAQLPAFQIISPINAVAWFVVGSAGSIDQAATEANLGAVIGGVVLAMTPGLILVAVILAVEWFSPRLWCRALCPLGALYSLLGRVAIFRVRLVSDRLVKRPCLQCAYRCPMGVDVVEDYILPRATSINHPDCTRCGACIDTCPRGVLRLGYRSEPVVPPDDQCHSCKHDDASFVGADALGTADKQELPK